ncbi:tumor necrosis factor receptor superfamily member 23-like isoform X1 [Pseudochaenichthys georgianus]|uniref:tumor necrosis factor receptor superfamily member 23-like isoform X1 n=2 Tax=Pseudochaenichthys georgianus TaxID=52239 RepID=UPI00146E49AD|nr:tumor necrosis factor receptor superfamily member 23 [Pseudochaenichthys georgianus]
MKTAYSSKFPSWFFIVGLVSLRSVDFTSAIRETQQCVVGTYEHEGVTCCVCGAGMFVESHCTTTQPGKCTSCREGTYSSHPNFQESCEPCTSCSHLYDNLELDVTCTRARDATCRCKNNYFCSIGKETCKICYPCKECTEGVKVACTTTNNTVCSEKTEGGTNTGLIVGLTVSIALILILGLLVFFWIGTCNRNNTPDEERNGCGLESPFLTEPLLDRDLPDIAEIIGWTDMKAIATRSGMLDTAIENCKLNHVGDAREQTLALLQEFVQKEGSQARTTLIQTLQKSGKRRIAEMVIAKLNSSA